MSTDPHDSDLVVIHRADGTTEMIDHVTEGNCTTFTSPVNMVHGDSIEVTVTYTFSQENQ